MNDKYATNDNNLSELIAGLLTIGLWFLLVQKLTLDTRFGFFAGLLNVRNVSRPHVEVHKGNVFLQFK
jgi:hypothetical protein